MHTHNKNMAEAKTIQRGKAYVIILTHNLHTRREVHSLIVLGYKIFPNKKKKLDSRTASKLIFLQLENIISTL